MPDKLAYKAVDPELVDVACHLAHCKPEDLMAVAQREGTLVVIVQPGPKHVFSAQQVADAVKELHVPKEHGKIVPKPDAAAQHQAKPPDEVAGTVTAAPSFARERDYTSSHEPLDPDEPNTPRTAWGAGGKPKPKRT